MIRIFLFLALQLVPLLVFGLLAVAITRRACSGIGWGVFSFIAAIPIALGSTSVIDYVALHLIGHASSSFFWVEAVTFVVVTITTLTLFRCGVPSKMLPHSQRWSVETFALLGIFATCLSVHGMRHIQYIYSNPYGLWDAWAIWNYRAAYILRAESDWRRAFSPLGDWQHADYPLLLPLQILRGWLAWGGENPLIPELVASGFGGAILLMLVVCVGLARGWNLGLLCGIIILCQGHLAFHTASMYADIPLASLMLSCLLFVYLAFETSRGVALLGLAGAAAGLCAWTKNEGIAFCIVVAISLCATIAASEGLAAAVKKVSGFLAGATVGIAPVIHFKATYAPKNELISVGSSALSRIFEMERYATIFASFSAQYRSVFTPLVAVLLLAIAAVQLRLVRKQFLSFFVLVYGGIMAIYFAVFLTTPYNLGWHLSTAVDRVFIQTYPFVYAGVFLLMAPLRNFLRRLGL